MHSNGRQSSQSKATHAIVFSFERNPPWSSSRVRACSIEDLKSVTPNGTKIKEGDLVEIKYFDVYHPVLVQEIHEDSDIRVLIIGLHQEHGYYRETRGWTQAVTLGLIKEKRPYWACTMADEPFGPVSEPNTTVDSIMGGRTKTLDVSHAKKALGAPAETRTSSVSRSNGSKTLFGEKKGKMESSSEENSSSDEEAPPKPSAAVIETPSVSLEKMGPFAPARCSTPLVSRSNGSTAVFPEKKRKMSSSSEENSSDDEAPMKHSAATETPHVPPTKKAPAKSGTPSVSDSVGSKKEKVASSSDENSSSDEEAPTETPDVPPAKSRSPSVSLDDMLMASDSEKKRKMSSSSDESSSDDDEAPMKPSATVTETSDVSLAKKAPVAPTKSSTPSVSHMNGSKKGKMVSSSAENSSDEETPTQPSAVAAETSAVLLAKKAPVAKAKSPTPTVSDSVGSKQGKVASSSDENSSDDEEAPIKPPAAATATPDVLLGKKAPPAPAKSRTPSVSCSNGSKPFVGEKKGKIASSSDEDSSDDDEAPPKPSAAVTTEKSAVPKSIPEKVFLKKTADSSEESSDEAALPPKQALVAKPVSVKTAPTAKAQTSSSEDSSDDDEPAPVKPVPLAKCVLPAKTTTVMTVPASKKRGANTSKSGSVAVKPVPAKSTSVPNTAVRGAKPVPAKGGPIGKKVVYPKKSSSSDSSDDDKHVPCRRNSALKMKLLMAKMALAKKTQKDSSQESLHDDKPASSKPAKSSPIKTAPVKKTPGNGSQDRSDAEKTAPAKAAPLKTVPGKRARSSSSEYDSRDGGTPATKKPQGNAVLAMKPTLQKLVPVAKMKARSSSESSGEEEKPTAPEQPIKSAVRLRRLATFDGKEWKSGTAVKRVTGSADSKASSDEGKTHPFLKF